MFWSMPTQSPKRSAEQVAAHLGRPVADIQMFNTFLGGGFGRKGLDFGATFGQQLSAQRTSGTGDLGSRD